jgi:hypothetical protein
MSRRLCMTHDSQELEDVTTPEDHLQRLRSDMASLVERRRGKWPPAPAAAAVCGAVAGGVLNEAQNDNAMWTERYQPQKPSQVWE